MAGSPEYLALLDQMRDLHVNKSAGYAGADNPDPWSNFRQSERFGLAPEIGALVRMSDKWSRICALVRDPANDKINESVEDTAMDPAAYALIYICLRRERQEGDGPMAVVRVPDGT
jgi:hypothetical protein